MSTDCRTAPGPGLVAAGAAGAVLARIQRTSAVCKRRDVTCTGRAELAR